VKNRPFEWEETVPNENLNTNHARTSEDPALENLGAEIHEADGFVAARCPVHQPGTMLNPLSFAELAKGLDDVWIEGGGQLYRLRQTKQNKLILTK
jgi:hemin uptake protein HemP